MENKLYVDLWDYDDKRYPFQIFIGGYGMGKSYSALKGSLDRGINLLYLRRTETTLKSITSGKMGDGGNPFSPINENTDYNVGIHPIQEKLSGIYQREYDEKTGLNKPVGSEIGHATALPCLSKIRGAGLESTELILYDEFIKESIEKNMTGEFKALQRGYETVNRNKEFEGKAPTRMWLLSNAEDIYNPIFIGYGIVSDYEKMIREGKHHKYFPNRRLAIHWLESSKKFQEKKRNTAIMQLMQGTQYEDVAIANQFANNDFENVKYMRLTGYAPIVSWGAATLYKKKSERLYYVSYQRAQCPHYNIDSETDMKRFRRNYALGLQDLYIADRIYYESYQLKRILLDNIF